MFGIWRVCFVQNPERRNRAKDQRGGRSHEVQECIIEEGHVEDRESKRCSGTSTMVAPEVMFERSTRIMGIVRTTQHTCSHLHMNGYLERQAPCRAHSVPRWCYPVVQHLALMMNGDHGKCTDKPGPAWQQQLDVAPREPYEEFGNITRVRWTYVADDEAQAMQLCLGFGWVASVISTYRAYLILAVLCSGG